MTMGREMQTAEAQAGAVLREIVNGDGYFKCAKFRCRMPVATCLSRQAANARGAETPHIGCDDCDQGDEIRIADFDRRKQANKPRKMSPEAIAQAREHIARLGEKFREQVRNLGIAKQEDITMVPDQASDPTIAASPAVIPAQAGIQAASGDQEKKEAPKSTEQTTKQTSKPAYTLMTGQCSNCKRPDLRGIKLKGGFLCWQCQKYASGTGGRGGDPELRKKLLAESAESYGKLKPGQHAPYGMGRHAHRKARRTAAASPQVEAKSRKKAPDGAPTSRSRPPAPVKVEDLHQVVEGASIWGEGVESGIPAVLSKTAEPQTIIPVTFRLTVEIVVKVNVIEM